MSWGKDRPSVSASRRLPVRISPSHPQVTTQREQEEMKRQTNSDPLTVRGGIVSRRIRQEGLSPGGSRVHIPWQNTREIFFFISLTSCHAISGLCEPLCWAQLYWNNRYNKNGDRMSRSSPLCLCTGSWKHVGGVAVQLQNFLYPPNCFIRGDVCSFLRYEIFASLQCKYKSKGLRILSLPVCGTWLSGVWVGPPQGSVFISPPSSKLITGLH
jgi:hypothetical protein